MGRGEFVVMVIESTGASNLQKLNCPPDSR